MKRLTREWVRKAETDLLAAEALNRGKGLLHDQVCFHCQQSAEKYLKSLLEERGLAVPRTHILEISLMLALPCHPSLPTFRAWDAFIDALCDQHTLSRR